MGLNFRKSLSLGKLFRINFSKRGVGVSAGVKGARVSLTKEGIRETFSLPGTGLSWSERQSFRKKKSAAQGVSSAGQAVGGKAGKKVNIGSLVWVALVAGAFLLYRSGALDPAVAKIQSFFTGTGTIISASASPMANSTSSAAPEASSDKQSSNAPEASSDQTSDTPEASSDNQASISSPAITSKETITPAAASKDSTGAASPAGDSSAGKGSTVKLKDGKVMLSAATKYVASKPGSKFHKLSCRTVSSIAIKNLVEYETREEADDKKEPCSVCDP